MYKINVDSAVARSGDGGAFAAVCRNYAARDLCYYSAVSIFF